MTDITVEDQDVKLMQSTGRKARGEVIERICTNCMVINKVFLPSQSTSKLQQLQDLEFTSENINILEAIIDNLDPKLLKMLNMNKGNESDEYTKEL